MFLFFDTVQNDKSSSQYNISPSHNCDLHRPPSLSGLIPRLHRDGKQRRVPEDHRQPFVYAAVGVPVRPVETNSSQTLLFLYSQGTVTCTGAEQRCYNLNVTSCLVGNDIYPVSYAASGVYTCAVFRELRMEEHLTVIVSPFVWKEKPSGDYTESMMRHLAILDQLDNGSYIVQSDTVWEGQMDYPLAYLGNSSIERSNGGNETKEGRYNVCIMTQEKVFPEYIPEWIAYHRRVGVDYVYIYDNSSPENISQVYKDASDVEVIYWPWKRSQIQAQNHFILTGRRRCEWGILIDVDEYLMIRPTGAAGHTIRHAPNYDVKTELSLKRFLREMREKYDYSQIRITSMALGSSGHMYRPRTRLAEAYWHLANIQDNLTKPILWLGHAIPDSIVHHVSMSKGYYTKTIKGFHEEGGDGEVVGICHMKYRSWEDYVQKARGGRNSFQVNSWASFSSNWSTHQAGINHMTIRNGKRFTEFRMLWRRVIGRNIREPKLVGPDDVKKRYAKVRRRNWAWKLRRPLVEGENTTLSHATIEQERAFREIKDWEVKKMRKLARLGKRWELIA